MVLSDVLNQIGDPGYCLAQFVRLCVFVFASVCVCVCVCVCEYYRVAREQVLFDNPTLL